MARPFPKRVLAVDPFSRGIGFAILEGSDNLIDFGLKSTCRADNRKAIRLIESLIGRFQPEILALEDCRTEGSRRCHRVQQLLQVIAALDVARTRARLVTRRQLLRIGPLPAVGTKQRRASLAAERFPELQPFLPPFRKPWMSEDDRMAIFDAVGYALACFADRPLQVPIAALKQI